MATTLMKNGFHQKIAGVLAHILKHELFVAEQPAAESVTFRFKVVKYWDQ